MIEISAGWVTFRPGDKVRCPGSITGKRAPRPCRKIVGYVPPTWEVLVRLKGKHESHYRIDGLVYCCDRCGDHSAVITRHLPVALAEVA